MRVAFTAAAVALGDVGRSMFDATAIYTQANQAGAVSAIPYSAGYSAGYAQPAQYVQMVEYAAPQADVAGWGVADVAMLAVAGAVGAAVGHRVKSRAAGAAPEADVELAMGDSLLAAPEAGARGARLHDGQVPVAALAGVPRPSRGHGRQRGL